MYLAFSHPRLQLHSSFDCCLDDDFAICQHYIIHLATLQILLCDFCHLSQRHGRFRAIIEGPPSSRDQFSSVEPPTGIFSSSTTMATRRNEENGVATFRLLFAQGHHIGKNPLFCLATLEDCDSTTTTTTTIQPRPQSGLFRTQTTTEYNIDVVAWRPNNYRFCAVEGCPLCTAPQRRNKDPDHPRTTAAPNLPRLARI